MTEKILIDSGPSERGWHRLESAAICLRRLAFRSHGIEGDDKLALIRGSLIHTGLAHFYVRLRESQNNRDPEIYYPPLLAIELVGQKKSAADDLISLVQNVVCEYIRTFLNEPFTVLQVEEQVKVTIKDQFPFTMRWDLVIKDLSGKVWILDHKCSAKGGGSSSVNGYSMSGQFLMMQRIGQAKYGQDFGGVKINFIKWTPPIKFIRTTPSPAPGALNSIIDSIYHQELQIQKLQAIYGTSDPYLWPGTFSEHTCMSAYGPCTYYTACQWGKM